MGHQQVSKEKPLGLLLQDFYTLHALPVTQPTVLKQARSNRDDSVTYMYLQTRRQTCCNSKRCVSSAQSPTDHSPVDNVAIATLYLRRQQLLSETDVCNSVRLLRKYTPLLPAAICYAFTCLLRSSSLLTVDSQYLKFQGILQFILISNQLVASSSQL